MALDRALVQAMARVVGMKRRGPLPQPTALKVIRGNPGQRRLNDREPQHAPMTLDIPSELTDAVARDEWTRIAPALVTRGQLTQVDRAVFVGYCLKYAQWMALEAEARTHPFILRSPNGFPIPNPALVQAHRVFMLVLRAAEQLGLTPSSRSRVIANAAEAAPPASKWAGIL